MLKYDDKALLSVFGEKITYKGQSIKASVEIGEYDGKGSNPLPKDEVYINGEKWYVDHISNFDGTMYCLEIVHNVRAVRP